MKPLTLFALAGLGFLAASCTKKESVEETNNAGHDLIMDSITAHGGADTWHGNGQLQFRWTYHMTDKGAIVDTTQTVDTASLAVVHQVEGKDIRFGSNAGETWVTPEGSKVIPPAKFWSLTPYYFIGIPFVFNDPNAKFEKLGEMKSFEGKEYQQVKITYNQDAGDTPEDYYVLLIDPETKLTKGAYYIVTSKLVAPNGPTPPKFITLDNLKEVNGVKIASGHRTFKMTDGVIGDQMRYTDVSGVKFLPRGTVDLSIPEGVKTH